MFALYQTQADTTQMATFDKLDLKQLAADEGGFVNDPVDLGKETNVGVTLATWNSLAPKYGFTKGVDSLKKMTYSQWVTVVRDIWNVSQAPKINNQAVADRVFHITWGSGAKNAGVLLQRALNQMGYNLVVDGVIGKKTLEATNLANPKLLLDRLHNNHIVFLDQVIKNNAGYEKYRNGLMNRANRWYNRGLELLGEGLQYAQDNTGAIIAVVAMIGVGYYLIK